MRNKKRKKIKTPPLFNIDQFQNLSLICQSMFLPVRTNSETAYEVTTLRAMYRWGGTAAHL